MSAARRRARSSARRALDLVDAAIRHKLASGRTDVITFGSGYFTLQGGRRTEMNAELRLDAAARGLISGRAARGSRRRRR